jgi:hypothetical protein
MEKLVEAARHAKGVIRLESESTEAVMGAVEAVSAITAKDGNQVEFEGTRIIEGHGFALQINCFDIYECPNGYLLHTYMDTGPNWAVTGKSLKELLSRAPDQRVAKRAHGLLIQKNLIPFGH